MIVECTLVALICLQCAYCMFPRAMFALTFLVRRSADVVLRRALRRKSKFSMRYNADHVVLNWPESPVDGGCASMWMNFGLWSDNNGLAPFRGEFVRACECLCERIYELAKLPAQRPCRLICVGFGCGDELLRLFDSVNVDEVLGFNSSEQQVDIAWSRLDARQRKRARLHAANVGDARSFRDIDGERFTAHSFDAVVAVDCVYHFASRLHFFRDARTALCDDGRLVFSNLVGGERLHSLSWCARRALSLLLRLGGVVWSNLESSSNDSLIRAELESCSFTDVHVEDITARSLVPFANFMSRCNGGTHRRYVMPQHWLPFYLVSRMLLFCVRRRLVRYVLVSARTKA